MNLTPFSREFNAAGKGPQKHGVGGHLPLSSVLIGKCTLTLFLIACFRVRGRKIYCTGFIDS